ncbi:Rad3-related_DNA helicase [Hexamita inflata]|uniref:Rad3-related DNA helicase n=1 Tax=Hexamita inflata TaxID=28002 RepID=A0AA86R5G5_9EUKA|nr:Rad3-related DNA helicase [Hexamita inflata]
MQFDFPFKPYESQLEVMNFIYDNIISNKNSIVESPTGTGKSLIIRAIILKYLQNQTQFVQASTQIPLWILQQSQQLKQQQASNSRNEINEIIQSIRQIAYFPPDTVQNQLNVILSSNNIDINIQEHIESLLSYQYQPQHKQVIFASKTHTQLQQFTQNLNDLTSSTLSSRDFYCIHPTKDIEDIDLFCKNTVCKHRKPENLLRILKKTVGRNYNREELKDIGLETSGCPYYSSRIQANLSEVVLITHQQLDESFNENAILIIDEAHNLQEQITERFTADVSVLDIVKMSFQLEKYLEKQRQFLKLEHIRSIEVIKQQLFQVLRFIQAQSSPAVSGSILGAQLKQFKLDRMIQQDIDLYISNRFVHRTRDSQDEKVQYRVLSLLQLINNVDVLDKFIFCSSFDNSIQLPDNYQSYNYVKVFGKILNFKIKLSHLQPILSLKYKNVTCLGGTIRPFVSFERLFDIQFETLAVGHVIQPGQLKLSVVSRMNNSEFKFVKENQNSCVFKGLLENIVKLRKGLPREQNMIVFLPSYGVLNGIKSICAGIGLINEQNDNLNDNTKNDTQNDTQNKEEMTFTFEKPKTPLSFYETAIKQYKMHILFGVATASLAEGIDFKNDACRLLLIVGIPFMNPSDPFVVEKMKINPNFCLEKAFRSVNQCVGRSIRWAGDWAKVMLVDSRYKGYLNWVSDWITKNGYQEEEFE